MTRIRIINRFGIPVDLDVPDGFAGTEHPDSELNVPADYEVRRYRFGKAMRRAVVPKSGGASIVTPPPTDFPKPVFLSQPTISPSTGLAGTAFTATPGSVSNGSISSRIWLLNGTSIGSGLTVTPAQAGNLSYRETANGPGGTSLSALVSATVTTPERLPPVITSANPSGSYAEGVNISGTLTANEPVTWSKTGTDSNSIGLDPDTGSWWLEGITDYETKTSYRWTFIATHESGKSSNQSVVITITDVDEIAPTITSSNPSSSYPENSPVGGTLTASEPVTWSKTGSDATLVTLNSSTGVWSITATPDYESKAAYSWSFVAIDAAGNVTTQTVNITISDIDEIAPTITSANPSGTAVENQAIGGTLTANEQGTWSKSGPDANLITLNPVSGVWSVSSVPNYEAKTSYAWVFTITDTAGNSTNQPVAIDIIDVDENAPVITSTNPSTTIAENIPVSGTLTANKTSTWYVSGADASRVTLNSTTGVWSLTNTPDYETKTSYAFTFEARATINGMSSFQSVNLIITDVADTPPVLTAPTLLVNGSKSVSIRVSTDTIGGTIYFYLSTSATPPTVANLKSGAGSIGSGTNQPTNTGNSQKGFVKPVVTPTTTYYGYAIHTNADGLDSTIVATASGTTPADLTGPTLTSPTATVTGNSTLTLNVNINDTEGFIYWYVTTSTTAPTVSALKAGTGAKSFGKIVPTQDGTILQTMYATGLLSGTTYYAYFLQTDDYGNDSLISASAGALTQGTSPYGTEALAYFASHTTQLDDTRKGYIDTFYKGVIADGDWPWIDRMILCCLHDPQASLVDMKVPTKAGSAVNNPTHTPYRGFKGDGASSYVSLKDNIDFSGNQFTLNGHYVSAYINFDGNNGTTVPVFGQTGTAARMIFYSRNTAGTAAVRSNGASTTWTPPARTGHFAVKRTSSASFDIYRNGVLVETKAIVTSGVTSSPLTGLKDTTSGYSADQIALLCSGGSGVVPASFHNRVNTLLTSLGAN